MRSIRATKPVVLRAPMWVASAFASRDLQEMSNRQIVIVMRVREVFNNMSLKLGPTTFTYFQTATVRF